MARRLRQIAAPFAAAGPAGARVRTRFRPDQRDAEVLAAVGGYLGSLAGARSTGSLPSGKPRRMPAATTRRPW
jgi:hypothetical protein